MTKNLEVRRRAGGRHISAVAVLTAALCLVAIFSWLPAGDLLRGKARSATAAVSKLAPQGWGFFTKSPRGEQVVPHTVKDGEWVLAARGPNNLPRYAFGWDRSSRLTEFDTELVLSAVENPQWHECGNSSLSDCLDSLEAQAVTTVGHDTRLCGRIALVRSKPTPWHYRDSVTQMPQEALVLNVHCEELA